ncbi:MAG: zinc permease [Acidimicrobiia bacterium]|nr:zinc permease [Acidimicrobiia bacterium]
MSDGEIIGLGAVAGLTIFIGLPVGRIRNLSLPLRAMLNAASAGVLVFLLVETISHGFEPVEEAVEHDKWGTFAERGLLFLAAFAAGLLGLVYYERWINTRRTSEVKVGPGAASAGELRKVSWIARLSDAKRIALLIAIGIGLHNFAEGLAIGQSAANGEISFAVLLVIGFAVHNATEGFGIVAPLSGESEMPSWGFLATMGLIGGGPTFVGTVIGQSFVDETVNIAFLALAAGSILYVIVQLLQSAFKLGHKEMLMWGLFAGVVFGLGTELVLVAGGL